MIPHHKSKLYPDKIEKNKTISVRIPPDLYDSIYFLFVNYGFNHFGKFITYLLYIAVDSIKSTPKYINTVCTCEHNKKVSKEYSDVSILKSLNNKL